MTPTPPLHPNAPKDMCPVHTQFNEVCGGPHRYVETEFGDELLGPDDQPQGTPIELMPEEQREAHEQAVADVNVNRTEPE